MVKVTNLDTCICWTGSDGFGQYTIWTDETGNLKGDSEYKEAEKYYKMQKSKTKMVEQVLNALDKQSFTVNTLLKHMMWESGASAQ